MQLRRAVLVCNETSRRFENNNIQRTSLARENVIYLVKYAFFLGAGTLWGSTKPPTPLDPHKSTGSNLMCGIFGNGCFISG
jgi:hypothetical protein